MILDMRLPDTDGLSVLKQARDSIRCCRSSSSPRFGDVQFGGGGHEARRV